jgi:hypothetical protein
VEETVRLIVEETVALFAGEIQVTEGGVVSGGVFDLKAMPTMSASAVAEFVNETMVEHAADCT